MKLYPISDYGIKAFMLNRGVVLSDYEIYGLVLCLIVFTIFTVLFTVMLVTILNTTVKLIRSGAEDEAIKIEYKKSLRRKRSGILGKIISAVFCIFLCLFCAFFSFYYPINKFIRFRYTYNT